MGVFADTFKPLILERFYTNLKKLEYADTLKAVQLFGQFRQLFPNFEMKNFPN